MPEWEERGKAPGINRNIVECKGGRITISTWQKSVLIETLWNVKKVVIEPEPEIPRINRNIVECKGDYFCFFNIFPSSINRNIVECKGS